MSRLPLGIEITLDVTDEDVFTATRLREGVSLRVRSADDDHTWQSLTLSSRALASLIRAELRLISAIDLLAALAQDDAIDEDQAVRS